MPSDMSRNSIFYNLLVFAPPPDGIEVLCIPATDGIVVQDLRHLLSDYLPPATSAITYLQCGSLQIGTYADIADRVLKWILENYSERKQECKMVLAHQLDNYFPEGLKPEDRKYIQIIAIPKTFLQDIVRANSPDPRYGSRKSDEDHVVNIDIHVDLFLKRAENVLREYLSGASWKMYWEPPQTADDSIKAFIEKLRIPAISGNPILLLHNLGSDEGIVGRSTVDEVFSGMMTFLVNTSGSGKTRLLFEGLVRYWGFYFVATAGPENYRLGSTDLGAAVTGRRITSNSQFVANPQGEAQRSAYDLNYSIVARYVHQMLTARIILFEWFLKIAKQSLDHQSFSSVDGFRQHWLILQLYSFQMFGYDLFHTLTSILTEADDAYLMMGGMKIATRVRHTLKMFELDEKFFVVIDEAQIANTRMEQAFCTDANKTQKRPILSLVIKSCSRAMDYPIVVSGTGLSVTVIKDVMNSAVVKPTNSKTVSRTGAFDRIELQHAYIARYIPKSYLDSESGEEFLKRAWKYARGRHRFTASLLTHVLMDGVRSPHRILNAYINKTCQYIPTDAERLVQGEPESEVLKKCLGGVYPINFENITRNTSLFIEINNVLYKWLVTQQIIPLADDKKTLVELGFARFVDDEGDVARIDEPLVLLAATKEFSNLEFMLNAHIKRGLQLVQNKGYDYEDLIAYYYTCAFDGNTKLIDIFDFGTELPPKWAEEYPELVSIVFIGDQVEASPFYLPGSRISTPLIGFASNNHLLTLDWLKNPSSVVLFPDTLMGPDIVCFIRIGRIILALFTQCKYLSAATLPPQVLELALNSLNVSKIYQRRNLSVKQQQESKETVLDVLKRLNTSDIDFTSDEWGGWFQDEVPVLKAVASFPGKDRRRTSGVPHYATLKMDRLVEVVDRGGLLKAVERTLVTNKRPAEGGNGAGRRKKQRSN